MQVSGVQVWPGERRISAGQTVVRWPINFLCQPKILDYCPGDRFRDFRIRWLKLGFHRPNKKIVETLVIKTDKTLVVPVPLVGLKLDQNGPKLLFFNKNHHLTAGMGIKARGKWFYGGTEYALRIFRNTRVFNSFIRAKFIVRKLA